MFNTINVFPMLFVLSNTYLLADQTHLLCQLLQLSFGMTNFQNDL